MGSNNNISSIKSTKFRMAAAYVGAMGGRDAYERPYCTMTAAVEIMRGVAEAIGMGLDTLTEKLDEARREEWKGREAAGELMRHDGGKQMTMTEGVWLE
jgi:hypothetical protein